MAAMSDEELCMSNYMTLGLTRDGIVEYEGFAETDNPNPTPDTARQIEKVS